MSEPGLFDILRRYSALMPVKSISIPSELTFQEVHDFLLENILLNNHLTAYPPSTSYQEAFWKWVIKVLEDRLGDEDVIIDGRFYDRLFDMMSENRCTTMLGGPPSPTYVTHYWTPPPPMRAQPTTTTLRHATITLYESRTMIEAGTTGLRTWRASFILARYLIAHRELVANATVLELGAGTGFLGIVVASLQKIYGDPSQNTGRTLCLTDVHGDVLSRCADNVRLSCNTSSSHPNLTVRALDWTDAVDATRLPSLHHFLATLSPGIILGADILYHPDIIPALLATLSAALGEKSTGSGPAIALLAITLRNKDLFEAFLNAAENCLLSVEELQLDEDDSITFLELSEGVDQEVKILRISCTVV
ncbi:hypothetical protein OF83DRAFT_1264688 [Amylostereum chailletii]|nr:hypothetical protein OF83DRAFT_1264688 [Amylostereum chailletii]